jgi:transposase-like protein
MIVQLMLEPGASVAEVARAHGANQMFMCGGHLSGAN